MFVVLLTLIVIRQSQKTLFLLRHLDDISITVGTQGSFPPLRRGAEALRSGRSCGGGGRKRGPRQFNSLRASGQRREHGADVCKPDGAARTPAPQMRGNHGRGRVVVGG